VSPRHSIPGTTRTRRTLYLLPAIPDDATDRVKDGLAIRNACATEGRCPDCGARGELTGPDAVGFLHLTFRHEDSCRVLGDAA
jgi:hypothetical protein